VKTTAELEAMGLTIAAVERTMAAVTPLVIPGATMAELVESVEHELREAGSCCPSFPTHIFTGITADDYDSGLPSGRAPIHDGTSVICDFGGVDDGYCFDFGRTIYCGEPPGDYLEAYEIVLAAQEAGRAAARADTPAHEVNAACRAPFEAAGLGRHFRHRMGHCIGMDVHERPFISEEDETPLQPGMSFTDEPSLIIPGRYSLRIEDILVCEQGGGRKLNAYPTTLVSGSAEGGA
jgi:Xaa-Pro aminopeptidase